MKPKPYPIDKRRVIVGRGWSSFEDFFHQLPIADQDKLYKSRLFPKVPGFRPGIAAGNKIRLETLFRQLGAKEGHHESGTAWIVYGEIFRHWVLAHEDLNDLLLNFDNDADFVDQTDGALPNTDLDVACFAMLSEASRRGEVTREDIKAFYDFGYFIVDDRIERYIDLAMAEKNVQVIRELLALPAKVDKLRNDVEAFGQRIDSIVRDAAESAVTLQGIEDRINVPMMPLDSDLIQGTLASKADVETVKSIEAMVNVLTQTVNDLARAKPAESPSLDTPQDPDNITVAIDAVEHKASAAAKGVEDLQAAMKMAALALRRDMQGAIAETRSLLESTIEAHVAGLREEIAQTPERDVPIATTSVRGYGATALLRLESLVSPNGDTWPEGTLMVEHLERNARRAGLVTRSARSLAREVLAGLGAGQLVTFRGSVASLIASICAQAIAAQSAWITRIPVGMLSGEELGRLLNSVVTDSQRHDRMSVLIIEGLNRSALEVFGSDLSSLIGRRLLNLNSSAPNLCLLGTVVDGPSALPIAQGLCELGPILDVDALDWSPKESSGTVEFSTVPSSVWDAHIREIPRKLLPPQIKKDVFEELGGASILWERCVASAYSHLSALSKDDQSPALLTSLAFGWIFPYVLARGLSPTPFIQILLTDGEQDDEGARIRRIIETSLASGGVS